MIGLNETNYDLYLLRHHEIREHFPLSVDGGSFCRRRPDALQARTALRPKGALDNYFDVVDEKLIQELTQVVGGDDLVIKTHGPPRGDIASLIASGAVLANASIRDPREIALSMLDHGKRARRWKLAPFVEFQNLDDTLASIDNQIGYFNAWAEIPKVEVFLYNEICFDSRSVVERLASHIGVAINPIRFCRPSLATR